VYRLFPVKQFCGCEIREPFQKTNIILQQNLKEGIKYNDYWKCKNCIENDEKSLLNNNIKITKCFITKWTRFRDTNSFRLHVIVFVFFVYVRSVVSLKDRGRGLNYNGNQRWSDSGFLLSNPSCFWKMISVPIRILFCGNHTIRIRKLSESLLCCTTYIFVLCLFCPIWQNNCWSYFAYSWTRVVEVV